MSDTKRRSVCVYDYGAFVTLAQYLVGRFAKVFYFCPWQDAYPSSGPRLVGTGIPGVTRIETDIWDHLDEIDLFVFPEVCDGPLQEHLVSLGKRVWGSRRGEELELDRAKAKETFKRLGMDVGPYEVVEGIDALRAFLKKHKDQYVKINTTRADMETFHALSYQDAEVALDHIEHRMGASAEKRTFIVEKNLSPAIETGYDGYCIDGKWPKSGVTGVEIKDRCYVQRAISYRQLPQSVRTVNDKLAPELKRYGYRGFISTEVRATPDGGAYLIDPCARFGSPPNEACQLQIENLAEIMWEGADGIVIEPEFAATYAAELLIRSEFALSNWQPIRFPKSIADHVKIRNLTIIDGMHYCVPLGSQGGCSVIGAVAAIGDTAEEAIENCKAIAKQVQGHDIDFSPDTLDESWEALQQVLPKGIDTRKSKAEQRTDALRARGAISDKQYDKMKARA